MKSYTFHIQGMHCASCVVLIEDALVHIDGVSAVKANLSARTLFVEGDFGEQSDEEVARLLSGFVSQHGYSFSTQPTALSVSWNDFKIAIPLALGFLTLFLLLQKLGIVNLILGGSMGYSTAFVIGIIASLSTCMAVVGGLVLSVSANFAKEGEKTKPQLLFHAGRLISFFVLGGIVGALGAAFQLGVTGTFILGLVVGLVMLVLGLNLLDIFSWAKKMQPTLPKKLSRHVLDVKKINHTLTPILLGIVTFFLPCGFTQSMQIYALSTGNFWTGALTMFLFALGTLPMLLLLSFTSVRMENKKTSGIFFKTAGLVVILFGIFNIINSFVAMGIIPPLFNF